MEAIRRNPDLSVRRAMELADGTKIEVIGITARRSMQLASNSKLTDAERGMHIIAAKILVDGQPVVADDLLDHFTDAEVVTITEFVMDREGEEPAKNGQ